MRNYENKGFTLLELIIVIALMAIITTMTLTNYNGMNKSVELQNTVYNVALSIRESQVYGINKKLDSNTFSDSTPDAYGMHIDTSDKTKIIIFEDKDGTPNQKFDGGCSSDVVECEKMIVLNNGNFISNIRVDSGSGWNDFSGKLNILFRRPNPDALIVDDDNPSTVFSRVGIEVSSKNGTYKGCVEIGSAGDISLLQECH